MPSSTTRRAPPPIGSTIAGIAGLVLLALGHAAWFGLAVRDHGAGRAFDILDVFNAVMAPGSLGLAITLARWHHRRRLTTPAFLMLGGALTVVGLVTTMLLAVATMSFGG